MAQINLISDKGERFSYQDDKPTLGEGAMGIVYKGFRTGYQNRPVAIKRVHQKHSEYPAIRERAKFEASLSIDHPNLIQMLGYCEFEKNRGPIFIVSEFIQGITIDKYVQQIPLHERADIVSKMMMAVLDAMICLHDHKPAIWHRDIKPANIMVENGRNIKVMDLGIATSDGITFGTLAKGFGTYPYAPPEQITGKRDEVNHLSDIYSLGVTFYELLTGQNPFAGGSDIDVMEKQVKMLLPHNNLIPKKLFKVIQKATAKQQKDRYPSAKVFKQAIENAVFAQPDSDKTRKKLLYTIGAIIATFIVILLIFAAIF